MLSSLLTLSYCWSPDQQFSANAFAYISHLSNRMAKESNIVHQYFKKQFEDFTVMVKVDPIQLKGTEITLEKDGSKEVRDLKFDEAGYSSPQEIFEDLKADGFEVAGPLEFNLYFSGLS